MAETIGLTIDGMRVEVPRGTTVLQAALAHGIEVPFFCYHPGLSIEGSCRVCLVKVERTAKLVTACSTECAPDMVVHTRAPEAQEARAGVLEFLLLNHPLDCPVCDKGGECPLQDFTDKFDRVSSRFDHPKRTFDGEGVGCDIDFGPTLMLNRNRCILCSRCVRFMREVDGDPQIEFIARAYDSHIATFNDRGVHSLLSGNLMDVCPVGALTTKDYRFRSRPWVNLRAIDTVCTLCAKGCSTTAWLRAKPEWVKGPQLARITPRLNPAVNGYWMCDIGRFEYHWIESASRLRDPMARAADGNLHPVTWPEALERLASRAAGGVARWRWLVSAHASLEELFLLRAIALEAGAGRPGEAVTVVWTASDKRQPPATTFRVPVIDAPDVEGARALGLVGDAPRSDADAGALKAAVEGRLVETLYVHDPGPGGSLGPVEWIVEARLAGTLPFLVVHGVLDSDLARAADLVLPGAAWLEKAALYANERGIIQASARAVPPPGEAREDWEVLRDVGRAIGLALPFQGADDVRKVLSDEFGLRFDPPAASLPAPPSSSAGGSWLTTSNVSERAKWSVVFQDRPPVQFDGPPEPASWPTAEERGITSPPAERPERGD